MGILGLQGMTAAMRAAEMGIMIIPKRESS
jgi:hypothetical protein